MTFRAIVCSSIKGSFKEAISSLSISNMQRASLSSGDVRVKIKAASLNHFDLLMLVGKYQHRPELPFIVGSEACGEVIEVGEGVSHIKTGDDVILGMSVGALAEEIVVNNMLCVKKPRNFSAAEGSGFFVGFTTAYHGLVHRGNLKKGETLLVTGAAGGMSSIAIQLGVQLGATVIAAASSDEKLKLAKELGAHHTINYGANSLNKEVKAITGGQGADVVYEVVGGKIFEECARCTKSEGRLLVVGFASGTVPKVATNLPLVKGYSIVGVRAGASMMLHPHLTLDMYQKMQELVLPPPSVHPVKFNASCIDSVREAFNVMAERKAMGKVVIHFEGEAKL